MVTKNKDEWLNVRVDSDLKMRIQYLIDSGDYENLGKFTREAIIEKLEPDKKKGFSNDELKDLIRQVLREDPGILIEPLPTSRFQICISETISQSACEPEIIKKFLIHNKNRLTNLFSRFLSIRQIYRKFTPPRHYG